MQLIDRQASPGLEPPPRHLRLPFDSEKDVAMAVSATAVRQNKEVLQLTIEIQVQIQPCERGKIYQ
jgi:hypothetical protein